MSSSTAAAPDAVGGGEDAGGARRAAVRAGAHLGALWALAFVQRQLDLLRSGEMLALANWTGAEVVLYALALTFVPPLLMLVAELLAARWSRRSADLLHHVFVGVLAALLAGGAIRSVAGGSTPLLVLAPLAGALLAWLYARREALRSFLDFLSPAPVVVLAAFLLLSPVREIVFPADPVAAERPPAPNGPVVVVVFDEFPTASLLDRDGRLDASSYPSLARFLEDATWYRNATTAADFTHRAVPAIVSGKLPDDSPPTAGGYPGTLFSLLAPSHRVVAHEVFPLCPREICRPPAGSGAPAGAAAVVPAFTKATLAGLLPDRVVGWLPATTPFDPPSQTASLDFLAREIGAGEPPGFYFAHVMLPHSPWVWLPDGRLLSTTTCCLRDLFPGLGFDPQHGLPKFLDDRQTTDATVTRQALQLHLAAVRFVDRLVGRLLRRLRAAGIYEEATIVLTADHGVSFRPGANQRRLTAANAPEIAPVPLFVKLPGSGDGGVSDRLARTIDVAPTVAAALGLELPWEADGESLLEPGTAARRLEVERVLAGDRLALDPAALLRGLRAAGRRNDLLFDPGRRGVQLFRLGPRPGLLGRRVAAFGARRAAEAAAILAAPAELAAVDLAAERVPAVVAGRLEGVRPGDVLVVALNGRVAATTRAYASGEAVRFGVLADPALMRQGRNDVRIFLQRGRALAEVPVA